jgi:hypothetical protein
MGLGPHAAPRTIDCIALGIDPIICTGLSDGLEQTGLDREILGRPRNQRRLLCRRPEESQYKPIWQVGQPLMTSAFSSCWNIGKSFSHWTWAWYAIFALSQIVRSLVTADRR